MANTKKGAIKKTTKRGRDANEYKNDRENKRKPSIRSDLITIINNMGNEHTEKEMEGREAERRERYFSCSSTIEEEEELDDKMTKKEKRNHIQENITMSYRNEENSTKSLRKDFLRSIDKSVVSELLDIYEDKNSGS